MRFHQRLPTTGLPPDEAEIVDYVRAFIHSHRVMHRSSDRRSPARRPSIVELTATIGYYPMISCTLNAFELSSSPNPVDFPI